MMNYDILKKSVKSIEIPADMRERIIENTRIAVKTPHTPSAPQARDSNTPMRKPVRRFSAVLVAAMLVLAVSLSALAYVGFTKYENPVAMLNAFFGLNGASSGEGVVEYGEDGKLVTNLPAWDRVPVDEALAAQLIAPYISGVGQSVEYGDYTLAVEAMLFDSKTGAGIVYYTVENQNGVSGYALQPDGEIWWPEDAEIFTQTNYAGRSYIDEAMSTETKLYVCAYYVRTAEWSKVAPALEVGIGNGANRSDPKTVSLDFSDGGGMAGVELNNGAIKLSPIGMQIDGAACGVEAGSGVDYIALHYADGGEYVLEDSAGFISNRAYALSSGNVTTCIFNRIVDINSIVSVTIGSTTYDMTRSGQ